MAGQPTDVESSGTPKDGVTRHLGAIAATLLALWFLFGIPAYLLFGTFFD